MQWTLQFCESQPVTIELCQRVLSEFAGRAVTTEIPSFAGNPRDGFYREVILTARLRDELILRLELRQDAWATGDDVDATTSLGPILLDGPTASFATKFATWHALRDAFAALGWADHTLTTAPLWIVDDAEAAGEKAIAAHLRAEITARLVACAKAPGLREIRLWAPRADDLEAVLESYPRPAEIVMMSLIDCGLRALPRAFARFENLETLNLDRNDLDARGLRGRSLPALYMVGMSGCAVSDVSRDDVSGFPRLCSLDFSRNPLRELDLDIIEACPKLNHVDITSTPLASNADRVGALRARWSSVSWT